MISIFQIVYFMFRYKNPLRNNVICLLLPPCIVSDIKMATGEGIEEKLGFDEGMKKTESNKPEEKVEEGHVSTPTCIIVLGMAGSGKTTFVQRLTSDLYQGTVSPYVVNLDPACREVPYPANIDIRDTVNYKEVMKQYQLGPNGAIVTSLNLFATKFDQVGSWRLKYLRYSSNIRPKIRLDGWRV